MSDKQEVFAQCHEVRGALTELSLVVEMNEDTWTMRKGLGRLITRSPRVLAPLAEPRHADQEALDSLARELGGAAGDSRFGKNYHRYLEFRWRSRRVGSEKAGIAMEL